jgi:hypothetical protein
MTEKMISPKEYLKNGSYVFPFKVFDETPGGSNLGRIEWGIELIHGKKKDGRYRIQKMLVFARQTRDIRYFGKIFEIECYTDMLQGRSHQYDSFIKYVWNIAFCPEHKSPVLMAYPGDHHSKLIINSSSSIMVEARFE